MKGEIIINNRDAFEDFGITGGAGFPDELLATPPMKAYVENESRLEHGKHIIAGNKVAAREVTLTFQIMGSSASDFQTKKTGFEGLLQSGQEITLRMPTVGTDVYHLFYLRGTSFSINKKRTFCKMACKFIEPDPTNRT